MTEMLPYSSLCAGISGKKGTLQPLKEKSPSLKLPSTEPLNHLPLALPNYERTPPPALRKSAEPMRVEPDGFHLLKGVVKANIDASFDEARKLCSTGVIFRDDLGLALTGSARIHPANSPLHAEILAMKEAHELANNLNLKYIIFESDNQELISCCKKKETHWQISPILKRIEELRGNFDTVAYSWCRREANESADEIASLCKKFMLPRYWMSCPPPSLNEKIAERQGITGSALLRHLIAERARE